MFGKFDIPSIDHLEEGVDYKIVDWTFSSGQTSTPPVPHTPGEPCPPGHKMTFGLCRKLGPGSAWTGSDLSADERYAKFRADESGSNFQNNKPVKIGDKKYGWAMRNDTPVLVEWGSVAGIKTVGPKRPAPSGASPQSPPSPQQPIQPLSANAQQPPANLS